MGAHLHVQAAYHLHREEITQVLPSASYISIPIPASIGPCHATLFYTTRGYPISPSQYLSKNGVCWLFTFPCASRLARGNSRAGMQGPTGSTELPPPRPHIGWHGHHGMPVDGTRQEPGTPLRLSPLIINQSTRFILPLLLEVFDRVPEGSLRTVPSSSSNIPGCDR